MSKRELPMHKAITEAIASEMERDESVFMMGEDIGKYGGIFGASRGLLDQFGSERIRDTPISESAFIGAAIGAATKGLRPIAELMFSDFFGVAMDQIYNHLAKNTYMSGGQLELPVVIDTAYGGGYSDAAQHSQTLYATFAHMPGLKIVAPSNAYDAKGLMISAIREDNPVMYFFHKGLMGLGWMPSVEGAKTEVPEKPYTVPIGKAKLIKEGKDITVVTLGKPVHSAVDSQEELQEEGISLEVIDLRTVVPLDEETILDSVDKTGRLLVVDEDYKSFGLTSEIIARVTEEMGTELKSNVKRVAFPDIPIPFSRPLEQHCLPDKEKIVKTAREMMG